MSLEKIIDKITQDSGSQINEIVEQAKNQAAAIIAKARAEAALQVKARLDQAKHEAEDFDTAGKSHCSAGVSAKKYWKQNSP